MSQGNSNWQGDDIPEYNPPAPDSSSPGQANGMAFNNANAMSSVTAPGETASGMSSASPMSPMPTTTYIPAMSHMVRDPQPPASPAMFRAMTGASMNRGRWTGNMNLALAYGSRQTNYEVDTGIQLGSQGQGMLHQYQIGEASTSTPVPDRRALQVSAATHRLNSRAPMSQRQSGMVNYSFGSGSAPGSSGPERDSARKVTKRQGKRVARSDKEGDMSMSDSSTLQWRPGMRQTKILDSWSEERKEQTRIRNELISKCKADHTRDQNRVSARKSRQKKEDALQDARSNVQKLQEQNMALAQQAQELNTRINIYEMDIENRGQSIAMLASDNAALQARITQLEMQILQGGQSVQGFQTEETPAQELTPVLPPYSSQVQSQLHGSMFRQNPGPVSAHTQGHTQDQLQAQVSPSAQEGSSVRESSLSREIAQIRAVNLNDEHEAPSELSPMNTAQGSAELGGQDDVGDMSLYDYEGYFNGGGQA